MGTCLWPSMSRHDNLTMKSIDPSYLGQQSGTISLQTFNSFPDDNISAWSKLKAFADYKAMVAQMVEFVCDSEKNNVGKGKNAGYTIFSFSHIV